MTTVQVPPPLDLRKRSHEAIIDVLEMEMPTLSNYRGDDDSSCSHQHSSQHSDSDSSIWFSSDGDSSTSCSINSMWESEMERSETLMQGDMVILSGSSHHVQYATPDFTIYAQKQGGYTSILRSPVLKGALATPRKTIAEVDENRPEEYIDKILIARGLSLKMFDKNDESFLAITDEHMSSYAVVSQVTRDGNLEGLKELHSRGVCLQSCNAYGESIVHIVCRLGTLSSLEFLTQHANISVRVRDDMGRTPFHDAAWTNKPNFEMIEMLLTIAPDFLLTQDKRGHSALKYIPRTRWAEWCLFLQEHPDLIENAMASTY